MTDRPAWLALDIGGANVKAAHSVGAVRSRPFALWKDPEGLPGILAEVSSHFPPADSVAVTMTAELCDCFATKDEGVRSVLRSAMDVFYPRTIRVWTTDGAFLDAFAACRRPSTGAASNWLALATAVAHEVPDGLLVDVGSTTTDIIPLRDGRPVPIGRTDTDRLRSGELVYAGASRTPVCALATALPHRGEATGLAAELFATTRDVYLTLGDLPERPEDRETADGRPATAERARDRLARMVGADREGFSAEDAKALAAHADRALRGRIKEAAARVIRRSLAGPPPGVVVSGSGEFLAARLAGSVVAPGGTIVRLSERWGREASDAACAFALLRLAEAAG